MTYLNLFGDDTPTANIDSMKINPSSSKSQTSSITATSYTFLYSTEATKLKSSIRRLSYNRRPGQSPFYNKECILSAAINIILYLIRKPLFPKNLNNCQVYMEF